MVRITITKAPELLGVSVQILEQFVGLTVEVSSIPVVGWLGASSGPAHFRSDRGRYPVEVLYFVRIGQLVAIASLILACNKRKEKKELLDWLVDLYNQEFHPDYFLIDKDFFE